MKPTLPAILSNQKTAKKLITFFVMMFFIATAFAQSPTITSFSPASGPVGTLVTIRGTNLSTPTAFSIGGVTALVINNSGTVLTGFVMPGAATGAVSLTTAGGSTSPAGKFTVTATKFPTVQQGSKLVGTGNTGQYSGQGISVAVSADGNTAIVGGWLDNNNQGAAWVYIRNGATWAQQGSKLVGTGNTGAASQGSSVAISADGNTAIVGGNGDNSNQGAIWVFTRSGGVWSQQGSKLVGTGGTATENQGYSVAISADGNTAIEGGFDGIWVYTRNGGVWSQQGSQLVPTDGVGDGTGEYSVAISADGNTFITGKPLSTGQGAAWVFIRNGTNWSQQGSKLVGTDNTGGAIQGASVAISADGNTAIVGGAVDISDKGYGFEPAAAWVFTRSGGAWSQQGGELVGSDDTGWADVGSFVSLSADGNTAVLGGLADNSGGGAGWVFTRSSANTWSQQGSKLVAGASAGNLSVSLSADGGTAFIGDLNDNNDQGAAWVFAARAANASLSNITLTPASTLTNTGTVGSTTTYTTSVPNGTASVTVTPTAQDSTAIIKVNGVTVVSGTASGAIALKEGTTTTINTVVSSSDGTTTYTYSIIVTRAPSADASLSNLAISSGTLAPAFATGTTGYTANVTNATTAITVTPTSTDPNVRITVNGMGVVPGFASGNIALSAGPNTITTVVTAQDGTTTKTYSIVVNRQSNNALLSTIKLTPASSLTNTGTSGSTTTYTTSVANATASVTVTPTAQDPYATITVNGVAVTSGTASGSIILAVGANIITTVVTAQVGGTTHTYTITVTRAAASANATLSVIKLTPASSLTNTGTTGTTTTYTTPVSYATSSITVTPTAQDATATIKVNGVVVASGAASGSIPLAVGSNSITIVVTAQNGSTTRTYSIAVTRAAPSANAALSIIKLTPASALTNTGTSGTTTTYTTSVSNATTSVTVTPTAQDVNATIKVKGVTVKSGTASASITLTVGANTITTVVTAQNGTTTHTYTITVNRASGPVMSLYVPVSVTIPADNITIENDGVMVHPGVSPNGDGINDFLIIDGIIAYPDNHLTIIDRSGSLIYQAKGYNNISKAFDGHSNVNGRMLQPGTYFYSLDYTADGQLKHKTGFILLKY